MDTANVTDDYDNITSSNHTNTLNDYDNITSTNMIFFNAKIENGKNIDILILSLLLTKPCGLPFLCLMSLMVYTLIKLSINDGKKTYILSIQLDVSYAGRARRENQYF